MGQIQGQQRFFMLSGFAAGQAGLKLVAAISLGLLFGPVGIVAGVAAAYATAYATAYLIVRPKTQRGSTVAWLAPAGRYLAMAVPSTIALAALLSTDVVLVKHFFSNQVAGEYAAMAALGRAVFWGASGVAIVLFPKVALRESQGRDGLRIIIVSLIVVGFGGVVSLGALCFFARPILVLFAGPAYQAIAGYLPWYAIGMLLLGGIAVLVAALQSNGQPAFLYVLIPTTLLEPTLLLLFHSSVGQVVAAMDLSLATVLIGLSLSYVGHRTKLAAHSLGIGAPATGQ